MRLAILLPLMLAASCGNSKQVADKGAEVRDRPAPVSMRDPSARRQLAGMTYTRDGRWIGVVTAKGPMLVTRDPSGSRILSLREGTGYDLHRIDLGCDRHGAVYVDSGRGAAQDEQRPQEEARDLGYLDLSAEARRVCALKSDAGKPMSVAGAVGALRKLEAAQNARPPMSDAVRDEAREAMESYRRNHSVK